MDNIFIYNTLSRSKEVFTPLVEGHVGMYVCGPTVYGDAHLGHSRPSITFDLLFRLLKYQGYKVRYVRNITDVGHLVDDADSGEDKIQKRAALEKLEPMEVVQNYTNNYRKDMSLLNVLPPSIEPTASGHIIEQIEAVQDILESGYAYESCGSVYFDVKRYAEDHNYGKLSGRKLEDLLDNTRQLDGQSEKRNSPDFALWKSASDSHIMRWNSPWGSGFPGWHMECTAMGAKYLGERFDIHGGGMDLMFPHHEAEIAQGVARYGKEMVNYWMHNNMITINGQKMGKSLGNFVTLQEMFTGDHSILESAYSPMTIRFFILQAHYRSTLDFSNEALHAASKGYQRLMSAVSTLKKINPSETCSDSVDIDKLQEKSLKAICDDLNSPILIAHLFDAVKMINSLASGELLITADKLEQLISLFNGMVFDILGLCEEDGASEESNSLTSDLVDLLLKLRREAKENKNWALSDQIRDDLSEVGVLVKDTKDGSEWSVK